MSQIEEHIRNVPEANRERAFINAAKTEAMNPNVPGGSIGGASPDAAVGLHPIGWPRCFG